MCKQEKGVLAAVSTAAAAKATTRRSRKVLAKGQMGSAQHEWGHCKSHVACQRDCLGTPLNLLLSSQKCQGVPFSPTCLTVIVVYKSYIVSSVTCYNTM